MKNKDKGQRLRLGSTYLSSVISTALVLFLIGVAGLFMLNAKRLTTYFKNNINMAIYLADDLKPDQVANFRKSLESANYVRSVKFISKEQAAKDFEAEMGKDFLSVLGNNPLPESFEIMLTADYASSDSLDIIQHKYEKLPQVQSVKYEKTFLDLVNKNIQKVNIIMIVFIALLLFVSIVLINNTIRLSIYSKRLEIYTMKLVGATYGFISRPFWWQSVVRGAISGIIAAGMLYAVIIAVQSELKGIIEFADLNTMIVFFASIVFLGIIINFVSTYFAVHRFIRLDVNKLYY